MSETATPSTAASAATSAAPAATTNAGSSSPAPVAGAGANASTQAAPSSSSSPTDSGTSTSSSTRPWHEAIITDGRLAPDYLEKLPEPLAKVMKDNMAAARAKQAGTEGLIRLPGPDAKPEDWAAYHKAIGVPEKPEDYGLKAPEKMPDGIAYDEPQARSFASAAREIGLTPTQAAKLQDWQIAYTGDQVKAQVEALRTAQAKELETLKTRFGGDIDHTIATAKSLEGARGVPEGLKAALRKGAADPRSPNFWGPEFLEFAAWTARATGEDRNAGSTGSKAMSSVDLAKDIMNNKANPLHTAFWKGDPGAKHAVDEAYAQAAAAGAFGRR